MEILWGDLEIVYYCIFLTRIQYVMFLNILHFNFVSLNKVKKISNINPTLISLYSSQVSSFFFFIPTPYYLKVDLHYRVFLIDYFWCIKTLRNFVCLFCI